MAWNDKPTDGQIGALLREYEPFLLDELDHAKATGAYIKAQAIDDLIHQELLLAEIKRLAQTSNRRIFSNLIGLSERKHYIDPTIQKAVDLWLWDNYHIQLDYERVRDAWAKERERCQVN